MWQTLNLENCTKYVGFWLDSRLSIIRKFDSVCSQGYIILKNLWRILYKISRIDIGTQLIDTFILSRLNFCNALCFNLPNKEVYKLKRKQQSITPFLQELYFLQINFIIDFKVCLMVYKCINNLVPDYLKCMLLHQNTDADKRTRQDYHRTSLR